MPDNEADLVPIAVSGVVPIFLGPDQFAFSIIWAFGTHGDAYDLAAPAQGVFADGPFVTFDDPLFNVSGLSASAAMVSGALGLIVAKDSSLSGQALTLKHRLLCNTPNYLAISTHVPDAGEAVGNGNSCP